MRVTFVSLSSTSLHLFHDAGNDGSSGGGARLGRDGGGPGGRERHGRRVPRQLGGAGKAGVPAVGSGWGGGSPTAGSGRGGRWDRRRQPIMHHEGGELTEWPNLDATMLVGRRFMC